MSRRIQSPGVEIHELDNSQYDIRKINNQNGTVSLIAGFADKGPDYIIRDIRTMASFEQLYGYPRSEAEKYLYNATNEIIQNGGIATVAKLPYNNDSFEKFTYMSYELDPELKYLSSTYQIIEKRPTNGRNLMEILQGYYFDESLCCDTTISSIYYKMDQIGYNSYQFSYDIIKYFRDGLNIQYDDKGIFNTIFDYTKPTSILRITQIFNEDYRNISSYISSSIEITTQVIDKIDNIHQLVCKTYNSPNNVFVNYLISQTLDTLEGYYADMIHFTEPTKEWYDYIEENLPQVDMIKLFKIEYCRVKEQGENINTYLSLKANLSNDNSFIGLSQVDSYLIGKQRVKANNIVVVDKTRCRYEKDDEGNEIVGILPVLTTPINALYYQNKLQNIGENDRCKYNVLSSFQNSKLNNPLESKKITDIDFNTKGITGLNVKMGMEEPFTEGEDSVSKRSALLFPNIGISRGQYDRRYLKNIGIVVFKMFRDKSNENRIGFNVVESFYGTLGRNDIDTYTGQNTFIDNVVNQNSNYIYLFSNIDEDTIKQNDTYQIDNQQSTSLGFYECDTKKIINNTNSIENALDRILESVQDYNILDIDQIVDAGITNIAQFIYQTQDGTGYYDMNSKDADKFTFKSQDDIYEWKRIINKISDFIKDYRNDCYYLVDGPRSLCLYGNYKIIRDTNLTNTFKKTISPNLKYISGLFNSSYIAGYLNWYKVIDAYSGQDIWLPPSIKTSGVCAKIDKTGRFWEAPAGNNRASLLNVLDLAFNPTQSDSDQIYQISWNYAKYSPLLGTSIEGQRTFQTDKTALDRLNVRRLMNGLKKVIRTYSKTFIYEQNTAYLRQSFKDNIDNYLEQIKQKNGIGAYFTICDNSNNTMETIENHEIHISIYIKPIKTIEFIVLTFICTNQSFQVQEYIAN